MYDIKVYCALTYNDNTYKVTSTSEPKITVTYFSMGSNSEYDYELADQSVKSTISSDKSSVKYTWEFTIKTHVYGSTFTYKTISDSITIKI
jgi:hypothetical protein